MTGETTYLERYQSGEYHQVWADLAAQGAQVRAEPLYADAWAVACETMRRVRANLELLISRLPSIGYCFGHVLESAPTRIQMDEDTFYDEGPWRPEPVFSPPGPNVAAELAELETLRGSIPLSVMAWYQVVGSVNFTGYAPKRWWHARPDEEEEYPHGEQLRIRWEHTYWLDPIYLWPLEEAIQSARVWDALLRGDFDGDISQWRDLWIPNIPLGPDMHTKYEYSGGGPIGVRAPESSADGLFETVCFQGAFVDYLRLCCRYGGLPGLHDLPRWRREHEVPVQVEQIERDVRHLTHGLLPF